MAMFGGMDKLLGPMIERFRRELETARAELREATVEATAGGGMVQARANGEGELLEVKFSAEVLAGADTEMLQDLVVAAVREVQDKAKQMKAERLGGLFAGMEAFGIDISAIL